MPVRGQARRTRGPLRRRRRAAPPLAHAGGARALRGAGAAGRARIAVEGVAHEHQPFHREGPGGARRGPGRGRTGQPSADRSRAPAGGADRAAGRRRARRAAQAAGRPGARSAPTCSRCWPSCPRPTARPTPASRRGSAAILQKAEGELARFKDEFVSTEHLLLALVSEIGPLARRRRAHAARRHLRPRARGARWRSAAASASPTRTPRASTRRSSATAAT